MSWFETALILLVNLLISFAAGCATHRESYVRALKTKSAMGICLLMQFGIRPAIVFALMLVFKVPNGAAVGCMLCAIAPGGNGSNLLEIIFRGNIELGIVCTLVSSLCSSVAIPLDFWLYITRFTSKRFTFLTMPWDDISSAIACVVIGALTGALVRYHNDQLGAKLEARTAALGLVLLVAAVIIAVVSNVAALKAIPASAWVATIFPCPCALGLTYYAARYSGLSILDARTVATEVGECNIGVAYAILLLLYKDDSDSRDAFSGIVAYTVFNEIYIFTAAFYWRVLKPIIEEAPDTDPGKPDVELPAPADIDTIDIEEPVPPKSPPTVDEANDPPAPKARSSTSPPHVLRANDEYLRYLRLAEVDDAALMPPNPPR